MPPSKKLPPELAAFLELPEEPEPVPAPLEVLEELKPMEAAFVANLAAGMSGGKAMLTAGWKGTESGASRAASQWKAKPAVQAALTALKAGFAEKAGYTHEAMMQQFDDAIDFATKTNNATAYVRAVELKGKACGHLVDRTENKNLNAGFQIQINGIENRG